MRVTVRLDTSRRRLVGRRRGAGSQGIPMIVMRRRGVSLEFRVISEERLQMVVLVLRLVLRHWSRQTDLVPRRVLGQGQGGRL